MQTRLVRPFLSGVLVLPVCLTGVVTAYQFQANRGSISFIQNRKVVSQAKPGLDGFFQAAGLVPGFYTVVASGLDGVMTFGIEVQAPLATARISKPEGRVKEEVRAQIEGERF